MNLAKKWTQPTPEIDEQFIPQVGAYVRNFHKTGNTTWNFSCPICGDSAKARHKARGYIYLKKGEYLYHCHNCPITMKFTTFLRNHVTSLYEDYIRHVIEYTMGDKKKEEVVVPQTTVIENPNSYTFDLGHYNCVEVEALDRDHPCIQYLIKRKIPEYVWDRLLYTEDFSELYYLDRRYSNTKKVHEPRLVIPFIDNNGHLIALQGRAIVDHSKLRYITVRLTDDPLLYGLDEIDASEKVHVTEGPIDSFFLPNAIAVAGGHLSRAKEFVDPATTIIVPDNERRNSNIIKTLEEAVELGFSVCLWPIDINQKDVNSMIIDGGYSVDELVSIIDANTSQGFEAKLLLSQWRRD